jgi:hypothetical protein
LAQCLCPRARSLLPSTRNYSGVRVCSQKFVQSLGTVKSPSLELPRTLTCTRTLAGREGFDCLNWRTIRRLYVESSVLTFSGQSQFPMSSLELTFHGTVAGESLTGTAEMTSRSMLIGPVANTGSVTLRKQ